MGIFSFNNLNEDEAKALFNDALKLTTYTYHNLDDGLANGYYGSGFGLGLPVTLITALFGNGDSQGIIGGLPWNPDSEQKALETINEAGWYTIDAATLGYDGVTDSRGTYYGENFGYKTAQAEVMGKYDAEGHLIQIGIAFRGTSGPRENLICDTIGDAINDIFAGLMSEDYSNYYSANAFGDLLGKVAVFAGENGLSGSDVVVSGHSLGGLSVNSMAYLSDKNWNGFYSDANYIAFASPTQYEEGGKVLNVGFENDPVFRVLDGTDITLSTFFTHDGHYETTTDNIVNFNDYYASNTWNILPQSIVNIASWLTHMPFFYQDNMTRILDSEFYSLTDRDSTVVVANLSDGARTNTWVEDRNIYAQKHTGPVFIIGSEGNDLIKGGAGNDYIEGGIGDDTFRDAGGYNIISGGLGHNTLDIEQSLSDYDIAKDGNTLYLRDADGGITIASDIHTVQSLESFLWLFTESVDHNVTDDGLLSTKGLTSWATSVNGDSAANILQASEAGSWLFGGGGDDRLYGAGDNDTFVGGEGDDSIYAAGNDNTFIFSGDFGHDSIFGFNESDSLVLMGVQGAIGGDYHDFITESEESLVLDFGQNSITLVGVTQQMLDDAHVILA
ncbi:polyurethanase [Mixta tenebrionis]|uniref:Polyurethanase n=1 Tax=Mixta tenebrionis TaxID=2562439 RepID=A0A506VA93_9GAMM|nr:polyurethanase [Mixta tenebrionis]TPW42647.1 polyurethanase [Mixta tenebrionis]